MLIQNVNPHAHKNPDTGALEGMWIAETGQSATPNELIEIDDPDLFVRLCFQPANWAPADKTGFDYLAKFYEWAAGQPKPPDPNLPPPPPSEPYPVVAIVRAYEPKVPKSAPVAEAADTTKDGAS